MQRPILNVLGLFALTVVITGCGDGESATGAKEAIVDGRVDVEGIYPHVVLIGQGCTGTLITPKHVLTAAHCICEKQPQSNGGWRKDATYCQNTTTVSFESAPGMPEVTLSGTVNAHPMFVLEANAQNIVTNGAADLAMVTLEQCAPDSVTPVAIQDSASRLPENGVALGRIVGFGKTTCDAESRAVDRWWGDAFVTTVGTEFLEISSTVVLGDSTLQGAVSWSGDSGGPLLLDQDGGQWRVSGVLSKATCGEQAGDTAYYTNLHTYRDWLDGVLEPALGAACLSQAPTVNAFTLDYDDTSNEVQVEAELTDQSGLGLTTAVLRYGLLEGTECSNALSNTAEMTTLDVPVGSEMSWMLSERLAVTLAPGETLCVSLAVSDAANKTSEPEVRRATRCALDCGEFGRCDVREGRCACQDQWSGEACDVCTPACDGRSCGDDGCGGVCGQCNAPPPNVCASSDRVGETEDGLPIFGQGARSTITVYDGDGSCEAGDCRYVDTVQTCPDRLGYGMDTTVDYGCLNGACLERCEYIDHPVFDFADVRPGVAQAPFGQDRAYVAGVPTEVPFYCPDVQPCSGAFVHQRPTDSSGLRFTCAGGIHLFMYGQVWATCGSAPLEYPETLEAMLICVARGDEDLGGVEQLPHTCSAEDMNYSANSGYYTLNCAPPFPLTPCKGRVDIYLRATFAGRDGAFIQKVTDITTGSRCQ